MNELRTYLLVLRKHRLLLGLVALAVLGAGALYARTREPAFLAAATVQIKQRPGTFLSGNEIWVEEDRLFISDQVYRIRQDSELARRVVGRVRAWAADGGTLPGWAEGIDRAALARSAAALRAEGLPGLVSVTPVYETSYYSIGITGRDVPCITALANAYAEEIVALLREESLRAVRNQVDQFEREWQERRDGATERLAALRRDAARLQQESPAVDGARRVNPALLELEPARRLLFETRDACEAREEALRGAVAVLAAAGLSLETRDAPGGRVHVVVAARPAEGGRDPRLSPEVQSLPVLDRHEGVRRLRDQVRAQEELDRSLTLREGAPERAAVRRRVAEIEAALAGETGAAVAALARSVEEERARVGRLEDRVKELDTAAREGALALARMEEVDRRIDDVRREMDTYDARLAEATRLRKALIEAGVSADGLLRRIEDARPSGVRKVAPDLLRIGLFTALVAVFLAAGLLHLLQASDDTVKSREDYDRHVRGLPLLGVVPGIQGMRNGTVHLETLRGRTGTPVVESFRALRTTLQHRGDGPGAKVVLVTSAGPREGKTTLTSNLAASFARGGGRTLVIDGDLRRPRVHHATGNANEVGLSCVLAGRARFADAAVPCPEDPNLFVLPSGPVPPDPAELLGSPRMAALLEEARASFDRVLIDSPPVASVTDPCILARQSDAVVLVIAHGRTSAPLIRRARESLEAVGARVSGAVINNSTPGRGFYGEAYYGYAYRYHTYGDTVAAGKPATGPSTYRVS